MADAAIKVAPEATEKEITITTSRFGEIAIDTEKIITMTSPFLGFPESRRFILRHHNEDSPFMWMQSLDNPNLAFVLLHAASAFPQYQPNIPAFTQKELGITTKGQMELFVILTVPHANPKGMTANLLAPVAINIATRRAKQVLLDPLHYDPCWPVFSQA